MDINSGFNNGWQAAKAAEFGLRRHAQALAKSVARTHGGEEVDTAVVQTRPIEEQARVSAAVVNASEETLGSRIDEKV